MDYDATTVPDRYDAARRLPASAMRRWLTAIRSAAPVSASGRIADVGCGTGRFASALAEAYQLPVFGFDRSARMLGEIRRADSRVRFCRAHAEALPTAAGSIEMIFLSNVIHHFDSLVHACEAFAESMRPGGFVVVRNYVREQIDSLPYLEFFPDAIAITLNDLDPTSEVERAFAAAGFELESHQDIEQPVAESPERYLDKIRSRAYSDLAMISDDAFAAGVARMEEAVARGWSGSLVEPLGLLTFRYPGTS